MGSFAVQSPHRQLGAFELLLSGTVCVSGDVSQLHDGERQETKQEVGDTSRAIVMLWCKFV